MNEELNPISDKFIEEFLLQAQHHSGLSYVNKISLYYVNMLKIVLTKDSLLEHMMSRFINSYMITIHNLYKRNKTGEVVMIFKFI